MPWGPAWFGRPLLPGAETSTRTILNQQVLEQLIFPPLDDIISLDRHEEGDTPVSYLRKWYVTFFQRELSELGHRHQNTPDYIQQIASPPTGAHVPTPEDIFDVYEAAGVRMTEGGIGEKVGGGRAHRQHDAYVPTGTLWKSTIQGCRGRNRSSWSGTTRAHATAQNRANIRPN